MRPGTAPPAYAFRLMLAADLPMVRNWLEAPHVAEWWGDPDEQFVLVRDDLEHPAMQQFIVAIDDRPFAYLQSYDPIAWPDNGFGAQPDGTRGLDQFIGETDMIGCGHGSVLIRSFIERLVKSGTPRVVTDPDPANGRAVRAYEKAGFEKARLVDTPDGRALLMVHDA
ncbi:MAG: GNAT family N-acetyltransferase [Xanthobacteraceae bacterium]